MSSKLNYKKGNIENKPLIVIGIIVVLFSLLFAVRLFYMQIVQGNIFSSVAANTITRVRKLDAPRGFIYFNDQSEPLAINVDWFSVYITPSNLVNIDKYSLADSLGPLLRLDARDIVRAIESGLDEPYIPIEIASGVSRDIIIKLSEKLNSEYEGVSFNSSPHRMTIASNSNTHIVGYVGKISNNELESLYSTKYHRNSIIGKNGVEQFYDYDLRGTDGELTEILDAHGNILDTKITSPVSGEHLVLSIDSAIQDLAEKSLGGRVGSVIVMKPTTGEILAMVSSPWYDPNKLNNRSYYSEVISNLNKPLINRTIQASYPPASTFKLVLGIGILDKKYVSKQYIVNDTGSWRLGTRVFHCWDRSGHGPENLFEAIKDSCNIYFGQVGVKKIGMENILAYAKEFGFGSLTGIDLNGETAGFLPTKEWKKNKFNIPWTLGDTLNISIGQGFLSVTPIQEATYIAAIVNNGTAYKPRLLKAKIDPVSNEVEEIEADILFQAQEEPSVFTYLKSAMRAVVTEGTASGVMLNGVVDVAAKTGTAEIGINNNWHSWFVSFGPYETEDPEDRIVVITQVEANKEQAKEEYDWWAPKAADIIYRGVFADETYEEVIANYKRRGVWFARGIATPILADNTVQDFG